VSLNSVRSLAVDPLLASRPKRSDPEAAEARDLDVSSTPFRAPQAVLDALMDLARTKGVSRNQLILAFIDLGLRVEGRPSIETTAPGVTAWVRRETSRGRKAEP
jgi:hypothetical protein